MSFLKAEWRKLAIANYEIDSEILKKFLPFGTELDYWEDKCYISLVGLNFLNTRLLGLKIPFHINFQEVNLRFYVKRLENSQWKRGVVFIKEIVAKPAISFFANTIYKENYETFKMKYFFQKNDSTQHVSYSWEKDNIRNSFNVKSCNELREINLNSKIEFIIERYWGYARIQNFKTNEYEVKHPTWKYYPVKTFKVDVDFDKVYGKEFEFLKNVNPSSVYLLEGSEVSVEGKSVVS